MATPEKPSKEVGNMRLILLESCQPPLTPIPVKLRDPLPQARNGSDQILAFCDQGLQMPRQLPRLRLCAQVDRTDGLAFPPQAFYLVLHRILLRQFLSIREPGQVDQVSR